MNIIKKTTTKKPNSPKDPFEKQLYRYNQKMNKIFDHYSKAMFQPGVTFDQNEKQQQSMDLKLFLKYYKDYDLSRFYKVSLVTKLFKREAYHGIWLYKEGFFKIHSEILNLPNKESNEDMEQKLTRL